ncbi:MAG: MerR family transcriptional regulator [Lachnospiraceae bacterium]|nr:MerR family transcriptional regulator [Lachnospiraceae bacterium]
MRTVKEVSRLAGVSIRTLQYYDKIGLLHPAEYTEAGYRLYDDTDLERLQQILLFRELEFPLKEIRRILESPDFDRNKALEQQIDLLTLKKEHLEKLIDLARGIKVTGGKTMDFSAFDTKKIDEYTAQAKASWGTMPEYREYQRKAEGRGPEENRKLGIRMMEIFTEFGKVKEQDPASAQAQALVEKLQGFITEHFYTCSDEILSGLGRMYAGGGDFTQNIDRAGGEGTAEFANKAIQIHCGKVK